MKKPGRHKKRAQGLRPEILAGEIMTVRDVAQYLNCHPATLYRFVKQGEIPAFRLGGDWRFHRADVDAWIKGRQLVPAGEVVDRPKARRGVK